MRIGIDISQLVFGTGVSIYTQELVEALLKIDHKNYYVLFASSLRLHKKLIDFKDKFTNHPNVEFKFFHYPVSILEVVFNRIRFIPIENFIGNVDVFHSSDWLQPPIRSPLTKKITTVHDMVSFLFPKSLHPRIISNQKRRLNLVKKEVDSIIADSETTKEDIIKFMEFPQEKISIIYLAPASNFKPQDDDKVQEVLLKYNIKKPYILSIATLEPRKNIQKLIDVFGQISKVRLDVNLVLTGKYGWGPGFSFKSELPSGERIIWTEYVPPNDLIALYSGCRVFVYPSIYEGFGLPILEAMACGAAVVTSNNSSMAEIAKDAAILVDPRSDAQLRRAIEMVLDLNLDNYQKMVNASLNRARQYSWIKTAKETLKVYEQLVETA